MHHNDTACDPALLAQLTERERRILEARWGPGLIAPFAQETYSGLAERFHISRERARQIEARALRRLRRLSELAAAQAEGLTRNASISVLDLSVRAVRVLRHEGIRTIGELMSVSPKEMLAWRNCGEVTAAEIRRELDRVAMATRRERCPCCGRAMVTNRAVSGEARGAPSETKND